MWHQHVPAADMAKVKAAMSACGFEIVERACPPTFEIVDDLELKKEGIGGFYCRYRHHIVVSEIESTTWWHEICHSLQGLTPASPVVSYAGLEGSAHAVAHVVDTLEIEARIVETVVRNGFDAVEVDRLRKIWRSDQVLAIIEVFCHDNFILKWMKRPAWIARLALKGRLLDLHLVKAMRGNKQNIATIVAIREIAKKAMA